jgi:hypothetical protein
MPTLPPHPAIVHLALAPANAGPLVAETSLLAAASGAAVTLQAAPGVRGGAPGLAFRDLRLIGPSPDRSPR